VEKVMSEEQGHQAAFEPSDEGTATATKSVPVKAEPKRKPKRLPPFKVLLHNDEVNTFDHVISAVVKLASLPMEEAIVKTVEAHEAGVALLLVTHLERAELLQEQFASMLITVTFEAA